MCLQLITRCWKPKLHNKLALHLYPKVDSQNMQEPNPRKQCNAMILRGIKQLKGHKGVSNDETLHDKYDDNGEIIEKEVPIPPTDLHKDDVVKDANVVRKDSKQTSLKPYTSPLPFPQRMAKAKLNL